MLGARLGRNGKAAGFKFQHLCFLQLLRVAPSFWHPLPVAKETSWIMTPSQGCLVFSNSILGGTLMWKFHEASKFSEASWNSLDLSFSPFSPQLSSSGWKASVAVRIRRGHLWMLKQLAETQPEILCIMNFNEFHDIFMIWFNKNRLMQKTCRRTWTNWGPTPRMDSDFSAPQGVPAKCHGLSRCRKCKFQNEIEPGCKLTGSHLDLMI